MSKIYNSDATYCSEAEESLEHEDRRRSQRILEKRRNAENFDRSSTQLQTNVMDVSSCKIMDIQDEISEYVSDLIISKKLCSNQMKGGNPLKQNRKRSINCDNANDSPFTKSKIRCQNGIECKCKTSNEAPSDFTQLPITESSGNHEDVVATSSKDNLIKKKQKHCSVYASSTLPTEIVLQPQEMQKKVNTFSIADLQSIGSKKPLINIRRRTKAVATKKSTVKPRTRKARARKPQQKVSNNVAAKSLDFQNNKKNCNNYEDDKENQNPSIHFLNRYKSIRPNMPMANQKRYYAKGTVLQSPAHITPISESLLPPVYPPHFTEQLIPVPVTWRTSTDNDMPMLPGANLTNMQPTYPTPEFTESRDLEISSTSTPSLPDSLRSFFETDDIREILSVEKVAYRLNEHHVQILAFMLNMKLENLRELLERILKINSNFLHNIHEIMRIFPEMQFTTDNQSDTSEIQRSQSPIARQLVSQRKVS